MTNLLYIAAGGSIGAVARYLLMVALPITAFPLGTLLVNVLGSFFLGVLIEFSALKYTLTTDMRMFLIVGILGSFTTFSTFSLDIMTLIERNDLKSAFVYILFSILGGVLAFFAGLLIIRKFFI